MKKTALLILIIFVLACGVGLAQTTAFTYQGKLADGGSPPTGQFDFTFKLYDLVSGGTQIGSDVLSDDVQVTAGVFTVNLNFGALPFTSDAARYLEISVRPGAGTGAYTMLLPRQPITSSPYSVQAIRAASAVVAENALQLGSVNANQFVQTNDSRLTDDRNPLPNSPNYLQNNPATQQTANFNINGNGTVGGTLTGNVVNATTQFNIDGNRVLSVAGFRNIFVGVGAGSSITSGSQGLNSFFGDSAGFSNTTGSQNSFFGVSAGFTNTTGSQNLFFGVTAGGNNTTGNENMFFGISAGGFSRTGNRNSFFGNFAGWFNEEGSDNSFFGRSAGGSNTTGNLNSFFGRAAGDSNVAGTNNTLIGSFSNVSANNLTFATAIGSGAIVGTNNTVVLGRNIDTVHIPGTFNVTGGTTFGGTLGANIFNAATQFNIGGNRVLSVAGTSNTFAGIGAGTANTTGNVNSFFGNNAGFSNTVGSKNSFFGQSAGGNNITGEDNSFFGTLAGASNATGGFNSFFGKFAGVLNTTGGSNSFFGGSAGEENTAGSLNTFFGTFAGGLNTGGSNNIFIGAGSGSSNTVENNNTFIGYSANGAAGITNATAIGTFSSVQQSNSLVLGSINGVNGATADTKVGIGTTAPLYKFQVKTGTDQNIIVRPGADFGSLTGIGLQSINDANTAYKPLDLEGSQITLNVGSTGNVGIGTPAPTFKLQVVDSSNAGLRVQTGIAGGTVASFAANGDFQIDAPNIGGGRFTVLENGNVGIGNTDPTDKLNVNGNVSLLLASGGATPVCQNASFQISTCSSSIRYKQNINPFNQGLSLIKQLRPVSFNWRADNQADLGLVAEEVGAVEPLLTTTNEKGEVEGVKYDRVGVVLVNAVKEQQAQIEAQQQQIEQQRKQIESLTKIVCAINSKADICRQ